MGFSSDQTSAAHKAGTNAADAYDIAAVTPMTSQIAPTGFYELATGFPVISGTAYCIYLGQVSRLQRLNKIWFVTSAAAVGTLVQELGIGTTPSAPNRAVQTVTVRAVATDATDYTGVAGAYSNVTNLAYTPAMGEHIWVVARFAASGTQPTILNALGGDLGRGMLLAGAANPVLAVGSTITPAGLSSATVTTAAAPKLVVST